MQITWKRCLRHCLPPSVPVIRHKPTHQLPSCAAFGQPTIIPIVSIGPSVLLYSDPYFSIQGCFLLWTSFSPSRCSNLHIAQTTTDHECANKGPHTAHPIPSNTMNHYETLGLATASSTSSVTPQDIKRAYHAALLKHHPDKGPISPHAPSVDAIKAAYAILSNPSSRKSYDAILATRSNSTFSSDAGLFRTGEEKVDLDDLTWDEKDGSWYRSCRCGEVHGFVVTEDVLAHEHDQGGREVLVGCVGCSLWLRVSFGVVDEA